MGRISRSGFTKILTGLVGAVVAVFVLYTLAKFGQNMGARKAAQLNARFYETRVADARIRIPAPPKSYLHTREKDEGTGLEVLVFTRIPSRNVREKFVFSTRANAEGGGAEGLRRIREDLLDRLGVDDAPETEPPATDAEAPEFLAVAEVAEDDGTAFVLRASRTQTIAEFSMTWQTVSCYLLVDGAILHLQVNSVAPADVIAPDTPKAAADWRQAVLKANADGRAEEGMNNEQRTIMGNS